MVKRKRTPILVGGLAALCLLLTTAPASVRRSATANILTILEATELQLDISNLTEETVAKLSSILSDIPGSQQMDYEFWKSANGARIKECLSGNVTSNSQESFLSEESNETVAAAFSVNFEKDSKITLPLLKYLAECAKKWSRSYYYSPYTIICNASMMGKSRTILQATLGGVFTFSICLRSRDSTGHPARCMPVASMLENPDSSPEALFYNSCMLLVTCVKKLTEWLSVRTRSRKSDSVESVADLALEWYKHQTESFWQEVVAGCKSHVEVVDGSRAVIEDNFISSMKREVEKLHHILDQVYQSFETPKLSAPGLAVLFAFDEPGTLFKVEIGNSIRSRRFNILRRSFRIIPDDSSMFVVLSDTNSRVAQLVPPKAHDPSKRATIPSCELFPPYWQLASIDVWPECHTVQNAVEVQKIQRYSIFGRPGFHAYAKSTQGSTKLIPLLRSKLIKSSSLDNGVGEGSLVSQEEALAVMGARTSLNVAASCRASSTLCSSYMRMCVGISSDRESVFTFQAAEPCLAQAARDIIKKFGWSVFLNHLRTAIASTYADPGFRGELSAQVLLLMASDHVTYAQGMFDSTQLPAIPLGNFLEVLLKQPAHSAAMNKFIRVTQFVQMFATPTSKQLAELWCRSAAIVCKSMNRGCDLIIPVLCVEGGKTLEDTMVAANQMTVLAIQVKCLSTDISASKRAKLCTTHINRSDVGTNLDKTHPYFCGLLEMRASTRTTQFYTSTDLENLGVIADANQVSFLAAGLRPSDIIEGRSDDEAFEMLTVAFHNPRKNPENERLTGAAADAATAALKNNLELFYES